MEIEVLEKEKGRITFTVRGAGHTFCNNLKNALYDDDAVTLASYAISHPLVGTPTFIIEGKSTANFPKILTNAAKRVKADNKAFLTAFKKLK